MEWTEKERMLLKELKEVEDVSIRRYELEEQHATDPKLKALFGRIRQEEEGHLKTLEELERGIIPMMAGGKQQENESGASGELEDSRDAFFCHDGLESEKLASSQYDQAIFAFRDSSVRNILNHIQKEEQEHGRLLSEFICK